MTDAQVLIMANALMLASGFVLFLAMIIYPVAALLYACLFTQPVPPILPVVEPDTTDDIFLTMEKL